MPVVNTYTIRGLRASSEYVDIRVKAYNQVGESEWSEPLESAETKGKTTTMLEAVAWSDLCHVCAAPEPPSEPLHFEYVGEVTSHSCSVQWRTPHETGGLPLLGYELHYKVEVQLPVTGIGFGKEAGVEEQPKVLIVRHPCSRPQAQTRALTPVVIQLPPDIQEYTMEKLRGSTTYKAVHLKAFNQETGGRSRPSAVLDEFHTLEPTRLQIVQDEIRMATESKYEFIDSDVLQGFKQRYHRLELIEKLRVEEQVLVPRA